VAPYGHERNGTRDLGLAMNGRLWLRLLSTWLIVLGVPAGIGVLLAVVFHQGVALSVGFALAFLVGQISIALTGSTSAFDALFGDLYAYLRARRVSLAVQAAMKPGLLAFNTPEEMSQGRSERVEVAIARSSELSDALVAGLQGSGEVEFEQVPTSSVMGVELRGASFEIVCFSPLEQIVAPMARWEFDVEPRRAGMQTLTLCLSLRIEPLSRRWSDGRIAVPVVERRIRVRASVSYGARSFLVRNWQWLIGTAVAIGTALGAWAVFFH
jgi:hypothetical protein